MIGAPKKTFTFPGLIQGPGALAPQQLEFPSLAFPKDRTILTIQEVAARLDCSERHILDLIEEGSMSAFDLAGKFEYLRIPSAAIPALAKRFGVTTQAILDIIEAVQPTRRTARSHWRIPVKEGYEAFLRQNHSLNK